MHMIHELRMFVTNICCTWPKRSWECLYCFLRFSIAWSGTCGNVCRPWNPPCCWF